MLHCDCEWMWKFHGFNFMTRFVKDLQNPSGFLVVQMLEYLHTTWYRTARSAGSRAASSSSLLQLVRWRSWKGAVITSWSRRQWWLCWRQPHCATGTKKQKQKVYNDFTFTFSKLRNINFILLRTSRTEAISSYIAQWPLFIQLWNTNMERLPPSPQLRHSIKPVTCEFDAWKWSGRWVKNWSAGEPKGVGHV